MADIDERVPSKSQTRKDKPLSHLQRSVLEAIGKQMLLGAQDDPAITAYPALWAWCTETDAGKDKVMSPARLGLTAVSGGWIATLNHGDLCRSVDCDFTYLADLFSSFEAKLQSAQPGIKVWTKKQVKLRKRQE